MTKGTRATIGAVLAIAGLGCALTKTPDIAKDRAGIDATRNAYAAAWRAGDAEKVAALYDDHAVVLYPNAPAVDGPSQILAYFQGFFGEYAQADFQLSSSEIEVVGPWAFDRGTYRWKGVPRDGGDALEDQGKYLVILKRQADGAWKVYRDMDNSDRPLAQSGRGEG